MNEEIKIILKQLSYRPVAYNPIYAKICKSCIAGVVWSQLMYWWNAQEGDEFYKTDKEFCDELAMGEYEFKSAKKTLIDMEIIRIERKGMPAITHYTINIEKVKSLITSWGKNPQLDGGKTPNLMGEKPPTILYTENTTENTSRELTPEKSGAKKEEETPVSSAQKKGVFNTSSVDKEIGRVVTPKSLTSQVDIEIFNLYKAYFYTVATTKMKTVVEGIPRAVKSFTTAFGAEGVQKLKGVLLELHQSESFREFLLRVPFTVSPKIFFSQSFIDNTLLSHTQKQNGQPTEPSLTQADVDRFDAENDAVLREHVERVNRQRQK